MDTAQNKNTGSFKMTGNWKVQSKQLKASYADSTDANPQSEPGKENNLLARVEARLNKKRHEVIDIIIKPSPAKT